MRAELDNLLGLQLSHQPPCNLVQQSFWNIFHYFLQMIEESYSGFGEKSSRGSFPPQAAALQKCQLIFDKENLYCEP